MQATCNQTIPPWINRLAFIVYSFIPFVDDLFPKTWIRPNFDFALENCCCSICDKDGKLTAKLQSEQQGRTSRNQKSASGKSQTEGPTKSEAATTFNTYEGSADSGFSSSASNRGRRSRHKNKRSRNSRSRSKRKDRSSERYSLMKD